MSDTREFFPYTVRVVAADGFVRKESGQYFRDRADRLAAMWAAEEQPGDKTFVRDNFGAARREMEGS